MPTPTDRFALDTYDPGESWDHTDTVQFLDEIAVARDTVANRPTSGTYDGEVFFATDEEIFYQWDGTNTQWNEVLNAPTQAEFDSHSARHESGGADEIPLNNLDLPAGAQIDEDNGDLVIRDSGGSIVLRRDETAGTWDFVSGDLTGIASLEVETTTSTTDTDLTVDASSFNNTFINYNSAEIDLGQSRIITVSIDGDNTATEVGGTRAETTIIGKRQSDGAQFIIQVLTSNANADVTKVTDTGVGTLSISAGGGKTNLAIDDAGETYQIVSKETRLVLA